MRWPRSRVGEHLRCGVEDALLGLCCLLRAGGAAQQQLDAARAQAEAAGQAAAVQPHLDQQQLQIDAQTATLTAGRQQLDSGAATLTAQTGQLDLGLQLIDLSKNIRFVSEGGTAALAMVQFTSDAFTVPPALKGAVVAAAEDSDIEGVDVTVSNELVQGVPNLFGQGEVAGIVVAALVLLALLGTALGAALPLLSALVGIAVALVGSLAFSGVVQFTSITPLLALMLGLAVGIDYSLFIINRHREQLKTGMTLPESIGLANGTSGNAVVFAGATVIVALLALNITGIPFLGLMGTVGSVAVAVLVAVTLTPAVLSLTGVRILRKKERGAVHPSGSATASTTPMSTRRAVLTLIAGIVRSERSPSRHSACDWGSPTDRRRPPTPASTRPSRPSRTHSAQVRMALSSSSRTCRSPPRHGAPREAGRHRDRDRFRGPRQRRRADRRVGRRQGDRVSGHPHGRPVECRD